MTLPGKKPGHSFFYYLRDVGTGAVRYVGVTVDPAQRIRAHHRVARGATKSRQAYSVLWMQKHTREHGTPPAAKVLACVPDADGGGFDRRSVERFLITGARAFGYPLMNGTGGGERRRNAKGSAGKHTKARERLEARAKRAERSARHPARFRRADIQAHAAAIRAFYRKHRAKIEAHTAAARADFIAAQPERVQRKLAEKI